MKHLMLVFLIAAAFAMPRAHAAADEPAQQEPVGYGAGLLCVALLLLSNARGRASGKAFRSHDHG